MNSDQMMGNLADILIVDDEPNNLRLLSNLLKQQGYKVRAVLSGEMALSAAKLMQPELILLDIMMPDMDGYHVCHQLKNNSETCQIPVIFVSAKDQGFDKVRAFAVGGVDYITKPFQVEEVIARINCHLKLNYLQIKLEEQNYQLQVEMCQRNAAEKALQQQNEHLRQEIERRQITELALQKANQELARSNADLEQFAAIASHDLRSPLATINGYAQLLQMCGKGQLDDKSNEFVEQIIKLCDRTDLLIGELLSYAHLNQTPEQFQLLQSDRLVQQAQENLATEIYQNKAEVTYDALPTIIGTESQFVQLFQNLIENAIKYRREEPPRIHVSAVLQDHDYLFSIQDNGIGIDEQYSEHIFQIFKRLHAQDYPGTGIGLATCRKIVEQHGGSIWLKSEVGQGSTFYFTVPTAKGVVERQMIAAIGHPN
ncbi:response regulator [Laspinema olomoucense]|uniref:histidine kinase n=1 Tax=Laspinema olomoucense D3b TaxID=2953688 RepID=A0ABT2N3R2_9CYAN|nr:MULTISPECIES: response regulator [unclassified Laspinema]MCT7971739.1 response regulator [Laspinema sp. D3d]MCT7977222.1 response regulator [Laspinema sp. D3b]MCT7989871.1 response regulator [Laspinema sp. D3a]